MKLGNAELNISVISLSATPVDINNDNKIIRVNRMKVREDMIKHSLTEEVCIFHIMLVVIVPLAFLFISRNFMS